MLLPGSVTYDGGRVSPVVHEAKSTIALIFEEVFGGDISEKIVLNHFQRLRKQSDMMQMMKSLELIIYTSACLIYLCKNNILLRGFFTDRFPVMSKLSF